MKTALVYNPEIKKHSFGKSHPFTSERFENFLNFLKTNLPNFKDHFEEIKPESAGKEDLKLFHDQEYIEAMKKASEGIILPNIFQYTTIDNLDPSTGYLPRGIEKTTRIIVGASLKATELVFEEKFKKAISFGGLHHAKKDFGEGFCIYNDVVISAQKLLQKGLEKILILDTDAHAGNGTAEAFYEMDQVLLIDLHQDPRTIYPGTGFLNEIGKDKGKGFTINIPLPLFASDHSYKLIFEEIVFPVTEEFRPQIIIRNGGSDPHFADQLTQLGLTLEGLRMIGKKVGEMADKICNGKVIDLIGSGYNPKLLPLAWMALVCGLTNLEFELREPFPISQQIRENSKIAFDQTQKIIEEVKKNLKDYWGCFK